MSFMAAMLERIVKLWSFPESALSEYANTFVAPLRDRAAALGIPETDSAAMWREAVETSTPNVPPGVIMRRLLDTWESENKTDG